MSRWRTGRASGDVNSKSQPHPPPLMALMEAKVPPGTEALWHGEGAEECWESRFKENKKLVLLFCVELKPDSSSGFLSSPTLVYNHSRLFIRCTLLDFNAAGYLGGWGRSWAAEGRSPEVWKAHSKFAVLLIWPRIVVLTWCAARLPLSALRGNLDSIKPAPPHHQCVDPFRRGIPKHTRLHTKEQTHLHAFSL